MKPYYLLITLLFSSSAFAVGGEGHGGLAIVCRDPITTAIDLSRLESADIFEGVHYYNLQITESMDPVGAQIERVARRLELVDEVLPHAFRIENDWIKGHVDPVDYLPLLPDVLLIPPYYTGMLEANCHSEQLGVYQDDYFKMLQYNNTLFARMRPMHAANFLTHESLFKLNRVATGTDRSFEAREMNANLYVDEDEFDAEAFANRFAPRLTSTVWMKNEARANQGLIEIDPALPIQFNVKNNGQFLGPDGWINAKITPFDRYPIRALPNLSGGIDTHSDPHRLGGRFAITSSNNQDFRYSYLKIKANCVSVTLTQGGRELHWPTGETERKFPCLSSSDDEENEYLEDQEETPSNTGILLVPAN